MKNTIDHLRNIIDTYSEKLKQFNEDDFSLKPFPGKWSKKEELGHLIDSAHNNLRRFIITQYETNPKVIYEQDIWIRAVNYQDQPSEELILLWMLLNKQIAYVLDIMPADIREKICDTGKEKTEPHTLHWLVEDYLKHLLHHLHHLLEIEAVAY